MADASSRFALPFLQSGQAQKEIVHNEALARIDALLHAAVQSAEENDPPTAPAPGQCWIVGAGATGAWDGQDGAIAAWTEGGWAFIAPREGMIAWVIDAELWAYRGPSDWIVGTVSANSVVVSGDRVLGARQAAIASPAGGGTIDIEARAALSALLVAARNHGLIAT